MNIFKVLSIAVAALGACGLVAGLAKKASVIKEETEESTAVEDAVEVMASVPYMVLSSICAITGLICLITCMLFPVTIPLIVLCSTAKILFMTVLTIYAITYFATSAYNYVYSSISSKGPILC